MKATMNRIVIPNCRRERKLVSLGCILFKNPQLLQYVSSQLTLKAFAKAWSSNRLEPQQIRAVTVNPSGERKENSSRLHRLHRVHENCAKTGAERHSTLRDTMLSFSSQGLLNVIYPLWIGVLELAVIARHKLWVDTLNIAINVYQKGPDVLQCTLFEQLYHSIVAIFTYPVAGWGFQSTRYPAVWNSHLIFPTFLIEFFWENKTFASKRRAIPKIALALK